MHQWVQVPVIADPSSLQRDTKWYWAPRTEKINWDLFNAIDVDDIVRRGDISAVEFYTQFIVSANITGDDARRFGGRASLNMFMLMQLGGNYLLVMNVSTLFAAVHLAARLQPWRVLPGASLGVTIGTQSTTGRIAQYIC